MSPQIREERERLDKMRTDKFKFIMDAMASHAIEEQNTEYSASFISQLDGRIRGNSNVAHPGGGGPGHLDYKQSNNTVDEEDEESLSSTLLRGGAGGATTTHTRHQQRAQQVQLLHQ